MISVRYAPCDGETGRNRRPRLPGVRARRGRGRLPHRDFCGFSIYDLPRRRVETEAHQAVAVDPSASGASQVPLRHIRRRRYGPVGVTTSHSPRSTRTTRPGTRPCSACGANSASQPSSQPMETRGRDEPEGREEGREDDAEGEVEDEGEDEERVKGNPSQGGPGHAHSRWVCDVGKVSRRPRRWSG
jgi:hypothetical protein